MSVSNKQLIIDYLNALSGKPKTPEMLAPYVSDAGLLHHIAEVEAAFPSYELIQEQTIVEGDLVALRAVFRGVHRGTFAGMPATGKVVSTGLIIIYRIADSRIADHWMQLDALGLMQQLQPASPTEMAAA